MEIEIVDVKFESGLRLFRMKVVLLIAQLLQVPIRITDEFWGAKVGETREN